MEKEKQRINNILTQKSADLENFRAQIEEIPRLKSNITLLEDALKDKNSEMDNERSSKFRELMVLFTFKIGTSS